MLLSHRSPRPGALRRLAGARRAGARAPVRFAVCLGASLLLLGCSPSDVNSLWFALQLASDPADERESTCLLTDPVISDVADPEAVMRWAPTVCAVFDPTDAATALCIISYESGGYPDLTNTDDPGRGSFGLMQINSDWWIGSAYHGRMVEWFGRNDETYLDPAVNIGAAALLVKDAELSGWHSWASSRLCPHRH
ncbi:MAG: transglycosylase SLT domain-containing protein [bacterium]|nr:transglycosylase SLT domain-containing protein [bacterium]